MLDDLTEITAHSIRVIGGSQATQYERYTALNKLMDLCDETILNVTNEKPGDGSMVQWDKNFYHSDEADAARRNAEANG
jgi:hypothetical protein